MQSSTTDSTSNDDEVDPMRAIYLRCDLVCQLSCLALVLRAIPTAPGSLDGASEECITAARDALDMHQQCMTGIRACKNDPSQVIKYINW